MAQARIGLQVPPPVAQKPCSRPLTLPGVGVINLLDCLLDFPFPPAAAIQFQAMSEGLACQVCLAGPGVDQAQLKHSFDIIFIPDQNGFATIARLDPAPS